MIEITTMRDQKISDTMPVTASGTITPFGLAAFAASFRAYNGLVPMSPKTTPMQVREAAADG
jgi:hypothetical protein